MAAALRDPCRRRHRRPPGAARGSASDSARASDSDREPPASRCGAAAAARQRSPPDRTRTGGPKRARTRDPLAQRAPVWGGVNSFNLKIGGLKTAVSEQRPRFFILIEMNLTHPDTLEAKCCKTRHGTDAAPLEAEAPGGRATAMPRENLAVYQNSGSCVGHRSAVIRVDFRRMPPQFGACLQSLASERNEVSQWSVRQWSETHRPRASCIRPGVRIKNTNTNTKYTVLVTPVKWDCHSRRTVSLRCTTPLRDKT